MTQDEIKKALEICADISIPCNDCPYDAVGKCNDTLSSDALKLIIEQEKEIERLQDKCEELRNEKWDAQDDLDCYCDEMTTRINQAVKEFAERLKMKAFDKDMFNDWAGATYVVLVREIDELLKEYE